MLKRISRGDFLKSALGVLVASASGGYLFELLKHNAAYPCRMLGPSMSKGHRLRDAFFAMMPTPEPSEHVGVAILGGGMAGLSAGWWLKKNGFNDFIIYELENEVGGNSTFGANQHGAYPWGAHYVPIANSESTYVRELFRELGIIESFTADGEPIYNELFLCHEPQERLLKDGSWQEGLVPKRGLQLTDEQEMQRFFDIVNELREAKGADGKPAFAIPIELSSADPKYRDLDKTSMASWLADNGFKSRPLIWYVNYCCRDDYGSTVEHVSAWAALHYFAGRRGSAANAEKNTVVTWPEGNGYLVKRLKEKLADHIRTGHVATKVQAGVAGEPGFNRERGLAGERGFNGKRGLAREPVTVTLFDERRGKLTSITCNHSIVAMPRFIAKHVVQQHSFDCSELVYAPWLVANVTLSKLPGGKGTPVSWDNVSYYSDSLGYVMASHQDIASRQGAAVMTYYYPMSAMEPRVARAELSKKPAEHWSRLIAADLEKMHPGISQTILSMDLWPWGHGMVRPTPGFIWGQTRQRMKQSIGSVHFAHSDMSGISNFEEAQFQGVTAAQKVLQS